MRWIEARDCGCVCIQFDTIYIDMMVASDAIIVVVVVRRRKVMTHFSTNDVDGSIFLSTSLFLFN